MSSPTTKQEIGSQLVVLPRRLQTCRSRDLGGDLPKQPVGSDAACTLNARTSTSLPLRVRAMLCPAFKEAAHSRELS